MDETKIVIFKSKEIRKTFYKNEWWFVINDIIETLTDSNDPAQYFKRLKQRDAELAKLTTEGAVQLVPPLRLKMGTAGGTQKMYCWNTEGIFRLIQSIPSPKAEPFKRWLAKVGYERVQEIENPELYLYHQYKPVYVPGLGMVFYYFNWKAAFSCCLVYVNPARLHGGSCFVGMQTGAGDIAFFASRTGATADCPCFIVAIKKNISLKLHDYVIEIIYMFITFLNMTVQEYAVFV